MSLKRRILGAFGRDRLKDFARHLAVDADARSLESLVDALGASKTATVEDILALCSKQELKDLCAALDRPTTPATKEVLIARIVSPEAIEGKNTKELRDQLAINPPVELTRWEYKAVTVRYAELLEQAAPPSPEQLHMLSLIVDTYEASRSLWKHQLARIAVALSKLSSPSSDIGADLEDGERNAIIAAVHYFSTIESIIPDYIPGRGSIDDAYAVRLCLDRLSLRALRALAELGAI